MRIALVFFRLYMYIGVEVEVLFNEVYTKFSTGARFVLRARGGLRIDITHFFTQKRERAIVEFQDDVGECDAMKTDVWSGSPKTGRCQAHQ